MERRANARKSALVFSLLRLNKTSFTTSIAPSDDGTVQARNSPLPCPRPGPRHTHRPPPSPATPTVLHPPPPHLPPSTLPHHTQRCAEMSKVTLQPGAQNTNTGRVEQSQPTLTNAVSRVEVPGIGPQHLLVQRKRTVLMTFLLGLVT